MAYIEVIGTSHIAQQSIDEVRRKILIEKPDIVTVELDTLRFQDLMYAKRKSRKVKIRDIPKIGLFGWLFALIGAFAQKQLGKKAGAVPGSDMKAAVLAAREVGSQIALVDRNIGETIHRLSKRIPLTEKLRLGWFILFGWIFERKELDKLSKINLRKVPSSEVIQKIIYSFKDRFPNLYKILVIERDLYMVRRIKLISKRFPESHILAVVGAGHVEGIKKLLSQDK